MCLPAKQNARFCPRFTVGLLLPAERDWKPLLGAKSTRRFTNL